MATLAWFEKFPVSETEFFEIGESDHRPLVVDGSSDPMFGWKVVSSAVWCYVQLGFGGVCKVHGM